MPLMQAFCYQSETPASSIRMSTKGAKRLCGRKNKQINAPIVATKHSRSRHKERTGNKTSKSNSLSLHPIDAAAGSTIFQPEFTPFSFEKWSKALAIPEVKQPYAIQENSPWPDSEPLNIAPEFSIRNNKPYTQGAITWYEVIAQPGTQEIAPGVATEVWGYDGR
jgi:hypothetical protein